MNSFFLQNKSFLTHRRLEKVNILSCSTICVKDNGKSTCKLEDFKPRIFQNSHPLFSRNCYKTSVLNGDNVNYFSQVRNFSVSTVIFQADDVKASATISDSVKESNNELVLDFLPQKPTPASADSIETTIQFVGEPPFDMLGLASRWPSGWMQWFMEQVRLSIIF